jgi:DNA-binding NarL/FixJ family response regulator
MENKVVARPTLLLADDNSALRETLVEMLQDTYQVVAALSDGGSVLKRFAGLNPDLIVLDISLGDVNGLEVAKRLRETGSRAKIIFLTVHEDIDFVRAAFDLGASGYVFKSRISSDLFIAIDTVLCGRQFAPITFP